jgi:hypothetical protein
MKIIVLVLLLMATASAGPVRDGNWWLTLPTERKTAYAAGLVDGTYIFADLEGAQTSIKTFNRMAVSQLVEGMDAFYRDFRNRSLPPGVAILCVAKAVNGESSESIAQYILDARRSMGDDESAK